MTIFSNENQFLAKGMGNRWLAILVCALCWFWGAVAAITKTLEAWVELGAQVHDGFSTYIALSIRIGLDAKERLQAAPRELDVT